MQHLPTLLRNKISGCVSGDTWAGVRLLWIYNFATGYGWCWLDLSDWLYRISLSFRLCCRSFIASAYLFLSFSFLVFGDVLVSAGLHWSAGFHGIPSPHGNRHLDGFLNFLHIHPPSMFSLQPLTFPGLQVEIPIVSAGLNWLAGSGRIIWAVSAGCKKDFYFNSPLYFPRLSGWNFPLYSLDLNDWLGLGNIFILCWLGVLRSRWTFMNFVHTEIRWSAVLWRICLARRCGNASLVAVWLLGRTFI